MITATCLYKKKVQFFVFFFSEMRSETFRSDRLPGLGFFFKIFH